MIPSVVAGLRAYESVIEKASIVLFKADLGLFRADLPPAPIPIVVRLNPNLNIRMLIQAIKMTTPITTAMIIIILVFVVPAAELLFALFTSNVDVLGLKVGQIDGKCNTLDECMDGTKVGLPDFSTEGYIEGIREGVVDGNRTNVGFFEGEIGEKLGPTPGGRAEGVTIAGIFEFEFAGNDVEVGLLVGEDTATGIFFEGSSLGMTGVGFDDGGKVVGELVVKILRVMEGAIDGNVGLVDSTVGHKEGTDNGALDGSEVGLELGRAVGVTVGRNEGEVVGRLVGALEGAV